MGAIIFLLIFLCGIAGTFIFGIKYYQLKKRFEPIIDIEKEIKEVKKEKEEEENKLNELQKEYIKNTDFLNKILNKIKLYEEQENIIDYGLYAPNYSFENSEIFKSKLQEIREEQKKLVRNKKAIYCKTEWNVNGDKKEGKKQTELYHKLVLRAFNGECDSIISAIKWNNVNKSIEKIKSEAEIINKISEKQTSYISKEYINLKIEETQLKYEYEQKIYDEKEEQRRIKEDMKEIERAQKEIEKAKVDAEAEEKRYQKALDEVKKKLLSVHGIELEKLNEKMKYLEEELEKAKEKKQRALSMAQQTKAGHVYIISNIGSFGDDVYKIGMTRRLEPMDRVKELGDASVPFEFDVHGIIFSENAPELENRLHKEFNHKRVNMVNNKKEFFNVNIHEIEKIVKKYNEKIELTKLAEANQYRESIILKNNLFENILNVDNFNQTQLGN